MKQEQFEQHHARRWQEFREWLKHENLSRRERAKRPQPFDITEVPARYRELCQQLAIARSRNYSLSLIERLHKLALDGHDVLYETPGGWGRTWLNWLLGGFARSVRQSWRSVLIAAALFYLPYFALMLATRQWPDFAYVVLPSEQLDHFGQMYGPDTHALGRTRSAGSDMRMFGHYIANNIGIGFKTYAGGFFAAIGAVLALVYNGTFMGVVEAHVVNLGNAERFYSFVAGHSSFELTAIVLCGAAGLQLGWALIAPGGLGRAAALRQSARASIGIVSGAAAMLLIAAGIEAFWSPRELPLEIKYGVGAFNWVLVLGYFLLTGRTNESR